MGYCRTAIGRNLPGLAALLVLNIPPVAANQHHLEMSLQELLDTTVYTASKFPQKSTGAPAAVSIITRQDISTYGYKTLADILASVRGLHGAYDRNYQYLGIRGLGRTANYNNRFLLLVDGYRVNDAIYENAAIGRELFLDVDLIDRVEIVRGPGSSIHGSNAFLGVVNVFTKRGRDFSGWELTAEGASLSTVENRLTYGRRFDTDIEVLFSGTYYQSDGQDSFFFKEPEYKVPEKQFGRVSGLDKERLHDLHAKFSLGNFTASGAYIDRFKQVPTASFGSVINQPNSTRDRRVSIGLGYEMDTGKRFDFSAHAVFNRFDFARRSYYDRINEDLPPFSLSRDESTAYWWNINAKLGAQFGSHHLVTGIEFQDNSKQHLIKFDYEPFEVYLNDDRSSETWALYLQDELRLSPKLLINAGVRYDYYSNFGSSLNPRAAVIFSPSEKTALKFLYGTAFRAPSEYELQPGVDRSANPALRPEEISTSEIVVEHYFRPNSRLILSAYRNELTHLIELEDDEEADMLVFRNSGRARSQGFEIEVEHAWASAQRLRFSHTWQRAHDEISETSLANSPRHLAKLNFSTPLLAGAIRAGLELRYTSSQRTILTGTPDERQPDFIYGRADGYTTANLNLVSKRFDNGLQLTATVHDLFDRALADPAAKEHDQNVIPQDGRTFRLELNYRLER